MTIKVRIPSPFFKSARPIPISQPVHPASEPGPFMDTLIHYADNQRIDALRHQKVRRVSPPTKAPTSSPGPGVLKRVFLWLRGKYGVAAIKQLRVTETVSLGEKRFVAIIHAEGHKFLIGGGSSGVCLLTQLSNLPQPADTLPSIEEIAERPA
ncbi:MAG TPA: flagellar biosynthetic protein FliO [Terracidiphilus sp.]|nr:flagellar biosynthetic protein FliO [Terracidiphilus sp.]